MATNGHRPYLNYSMAQLEDLFARSQADLQVLDALDRELAEHRNTNKAARLLEKVRQAVPGLRQPGIITAADVETENSAETIASPSAPSAKSRSASEKPDRPILEPAPAGEIDALPASLDLGALPTFAPVQANNEPRAILAAWTALESLSPQTHRRPEVSLLNSLYMNDLARATVLLEGNSAPAGLRTYLGGDKPGTVDDLLASPGTIEKVVAPGLFPAAIRWSCCSRRRSTSPARSFSRRTASSRSTARPEPARPPCCATSLPRAFSTAPWQWQVSTTPKRRSPHLATRCRRGTLAICISISSTRA